MYEGGYPNLQSSNLLIISFSSLSISFTVQHGAAAVGDAAPAGKFLLDPGCLADIDHQTVIVREFLADFDIAQGIKKDAVAILTGFQIWFTGMIDPFGGVADVLGVDDVAVVQMKIEGVVGLTGIVGVKCLCFSPSDDFTLVLQYSISRLDGTDGIDALAVDTGFAHLRASAVGFRAGCLD